jgi:hypothetical protein
MSDQNQGCYARALGGCSPGLSREHYFSRSLLKYLETFGGVRTNGTDWLKENTEKVPLADRFVARTLCKTHNETLHALDDEAMAFYKTLKAIDKAVGTCIGTGPARFKVSGDKLERWCLKALCGFATSGNLLLDGEKVDIDFPPTEWLRVLYGHDQTKEGHGLYFRFDPGVLSERQTFAFTHLIHAHVLCGAILNLYICRCILAMLRPTEAVFGDVVQGAVFHPSQFRFPDPTGLQVLKKCRVSGRRHFWLFRFLVRASRDLWAFLLGEGRFPRH